MENIGLKMIIAGLFGFYVTANMMMLSFIVYFAVQLYETKNIQMLFLLLPTASVFLLVNGTMIEEVLQ